MAQAARAKAARESSGGRLRGNSFDGSLEHHLLHRSVAYHYGAPGECVSAVEKRSSLVQFGARSRPCENVVVQRRRNVLRLVPRGGRLPKRREGANGG